MIIFIRCPAPRQVEGQGVLEMPVARCRGMAVGGMEQPAPAGGPAPEHRSTGTGLEVPHRSRGPPALPGPCLHSPPLLPPTNTEPALKLNHIN